jgi:hypothetical protein
MSDTPDGGAGGWARFAQLVRDHPLLAVASALGSIGTFAAGMAAVIGLVTSDGGGGGGQSTLAGAPSYEYSLVSDRTGQISLELPTTWARLEVDGWHPRNLPPIPAGTLVGPGLNATTNLESWGVDLRTPGVFVGASREVLRWYPPKELVGNFSFGNCETTDADAYETEELAGETVTLTCAGAEWRLVAAVPKDLPDYIVYLEAKLVSTADEEAYERMLATLELDLRA